MNAALLFFDGDIGRGRPGFSIGDRNTISDRVRLFRIGREGIRDGQHGSEHVLRPARTFADLAHGLIEASAAFIDNAVHEQSRDGHDQSQRTDEQEFQTR